MGDISTHFSRREFACKGTDCDCRGTFDTVDATLLRFLEDIRRHFDRRVTVLSGCRCLGHNATVGGAMPDDRGSGGSQHLYGRAADIVVDGIDPALVYELAQQMEVGGLGAYSGWTHIDSRAGFARW